MNIPYPKITGKTEAEQIAQIRSFLIQLVDKLNYELQASENGANNLPKHN